MKNFLFLALINSGLLLSSIANSAIITANGVAINPLNLSADYNSFGDFYDYRFSDSSSHTGYEKKNRVVIFLTQIQDQIAMIMTAGGPQTGVDIAYTGKLNANVVGNEGDILFIDDPDGSDPVNGSTINWAYSRGKSDGLIYSGLFSQDWLINISLQKVSGGLSGIDVLSFDANNQISEVLSMQGISKNHFSKVNIQSVFTPDAIAVSVVSTPVIIILFGLTLVFLKLRTKR